MIKAIIFDCFGVVIADGLEALLLRRSKTDPELHEYVMSIIRRSNRGEIEPAEAHGIISEHLGISPDQWHQEMYSGEIRNQPVMDLILNLRNKYKTALLSNVGKGSLKQRFSDEELSHMFDAVVVSGEVGFAKPDPEIYEHTADLLGVHINECVFIDDRQPYVDGARRTGMQAILYENFGQLQDDLNKLLADTKS